MKAISATHTDTGLLGLFLIDEGQMLFIRHNGSGQPNIAQQAASALFANSNDKVAYDQSKIGQDAVLLWDSSSSGGGRGSLPLPDPTITLVDEEVKALAREFAVSMASMDVSPAALIDKSYTLAEAVLRAGVEYGAE